jgi:hypothetical protein
MIFQSFSPTAPLLSYSGLNLTVLRFLFSDVFCEHLFGGIAQRGVRTACFHVFLLKFELLLACSNSCDHQSLGVRQL